MEFGFAECDTMEMRPGKHVRTDEVFMASGKVIMEIEPRFS